jgi:ferredoxin
MCEFCIQHGEGKKWYLQAKNYSQELINEERKRYLADFFQREEQGVVASLGVLDRLIATDPAAARATFPSLVEQQKKEHWAQVLPLEDVEQILDMPVFVVRLPCICRGMLRGFRDARFCFGLATPGADFMGKQIGLHPDWSSDLEVLSSEDAKKAIRKLDRNGLVHMVSTFVTPYIGAICNCTVNECLFLKTRTRLGLQTVFKAEYVSSIDWENCNGCRDCMKMCSFGAISYSAYSNKCFINQLQCYGCGVCRALCPNDAITLSDRNAIPALANDW